MIENSDIIELVEYEKRYLNQSDFSVEDAEDIFRRFGDKVLIEPPSYKTNSQWELVSQGWVGYIPLPSGRGLSLQSKVGLKSLFKMLEYAYDLHSFRLLESLYECTSIQLFFEQLALILANRLILRARKGLYKAYYPEYGQLPFIRGKLDLQTISCKAVKTTIPCHYEENSIDIEDNQILSWTFYSILQCGLCTSRSLQTIKKADRILRNTVTLKPFHYTDCINRTYNRLNSDYEVLHKLCRFFLENSGPTHHTGTHSMIPFIVNMAQLFELFTARWIELHLDSKYKMKSQEVYTIGAEGHLKMKMDLLICDADTNEPLCVLDTKYKTHQYISNDDYNQVVAYSDAIGCNKALLIYPSSQTNIFDEKPGQIRVKSAVFDINDNLDVAGNNLLEIIYTTINDERQTASARPSDALY